MQDDLSLPVRRFLSLRGRTGRRAFNLALVVATLPFLAVMLLGVGDTLHQARQLQHSTDADLLNMLATLQRGGATEHTVPWAKLLTTCGIAYLLFPLMVRRLRDCGMAVWLVWIIYASITHSAVGMVTTGGLPAPLPVLMGLATLVITFRMSVRPSLTGDLPTDHRSRLLPAILTPPPRKPKVDPATFVPNDGDDERAELDAPPPK
jgi:uncharacterized membrane protein YhaH (DUF805 family)